MGNFQIVLAKVFAAKRQLVVHQRGQHLLQLQEQSFARLIAIGVHVEGGFMFHVPSFKQLNVLLGQQRGRGDGDGFVAA